MSMQLLIQQQLHAHLTPQELQVINESPLHNVPPGSESHIKVVVVSDKFAGQSLVARHRLVNQALAPAFERGLHALSIQALTPEEWNARGGQVADAVPCARSH